MTRQEYHEVDCSWNIQMRALNPCPTGTKALLFAWTEDSHPAYLEQSLETLNVVLTSNGDVRVSDLSISHSYNK